MQDQAIPILTDLITDQASYVSPEDRLKIAKWATMVCMTSEFDDPATQVIPRAEREIFRQTKQPLPEGWIIWCGMHVGNEWNLRVYHTSAGIKMNSNDKIIDQIQTTLIAIGNMDILAISNIGEAFKANYGDLDVMAKRFADDFGLMKIWPPVAGLVNWRDLEIKSDSGMDLVNSIFLDPEKTLPRITK